MTFASEITGKRYLSIGYYIAFDGIAARLSTHAFASAPWSIAGTYHTAIIDGSMGAWSESLDRATGIVEQGSLTCRVSATTDVLALFARRGGTETTLNATMSATTGNVQLGSGAATYANGTTIYIDRETITLGAHVSGGAYTGCSRGVSSSLGAPHAAGAVISDKPRHWYSRRATLYAVNLDTGTADAMLTGTLSRSPEFTDGSFGIEITGAINDMLLRPLCTGFRSVPGRMEWDGVDSIQIYVPHYLDFCESGNERIVYVEGNVAALYARFDAVNASTDYLDISTEYALAPPLDSTGAPAHQLLSIGGGAVECRQISRIVARPGHIALMSALSVDGSGGNGVYDVLSGQAVNAGYDPLTPRKRMGAGIPSVHVADTSFSLVPENKIIQVWLDEETRLGDLLTDEICWRLGGFVYCDADGLLTFKRYLPYGIRSLVAALTTGDFIHGTVTTVDDETSHVARVSIDCNYSVLRGDYRRKIELAWGDDVPIYGERSVALTLQSKSIVIGSVPGEPQNTETSLVELEAYFDRIRSRAKYGGRMATVTLPFSYLMTAVIGYRFSLTSAYLPDLTGAASTSGVVMETIRRDVDFAEGTITIVAEEDPRGWLIAPSFLVASYTSAQITIDTADAELGAGTMYATADAGEYLAVGWQITVYDASASPPFSVSATATISGAPTATVINLTAPIGGFTPAAGDLVILAESDDTAALNDAGADTEDYAFAADSAYTVGSPARAGPRWG